MTQPVAPPQLSPDGHWWWTGTDWVPASERPTEPEPVAAEQPVIPEQPAVAETPVLSGYAEPVTVAPAYTPPVYAAPAYGAPAYGGQAYTPAPSRTDGLAIASLVAGLVWAGGLGSIAAIITGHMSRGKAKKEGRQPSGMALAGLILGYLGAAFLVIAFLAAIAIPVFLNQRETGDRSAVKSDLRTLAIAEETYFTDHETYTTDQGAMQFTPSAAVDVAVLRADQRGYCLGGHKNTTTLYFDGTTFSSVSCA